MRGKHLGRWGRAVAAALGVGLAAGAAAAQPARSAPAKAPPAKAPPAATPPAATPPAPPAETPLAESLTGMARAEHGAGAALFDDGDYAGALARYERAYELSRDHRLLWKIALCQKNLRRYASMLATLRRLEAEGGAALSARDRQDIADLLKAAGNFVSLLEITASEPGAAVFVDDERVGTTPLAAPVPIDIGERRIRVSKPGFVDFVRQVKVVGGDSVALVARLDRAVHRGRLAIAAGQDDLIAIDGKVVGKGRWEGSVQSGTHALRVTAPGMAPHEAQILVRDDQRRRIDVSLERAAQRGGASKWLWIGGGAAIFAGALVAGALLFEPGTPVEQGSLGTVPLGFGGRR
ncbi:PEGA domain-containing protein [Sorangium sp. So ce124]|uniref:PEGA domain-containing protein n=1 Tax=Sorangium sp. So ce124 TaxID=3133280 RepID=UPI003F623BFA